jgi:hypothetical protein
MVFSMKVDTIRLAIPVSVLLIVLLSFFYGCSQPAVTTTKTPTSTVTTSPPTEKTISWAELKQGIADGTAVAQEIINLITENNAWLPPVPPAGGTRARVLSENEKAKILQLALNFSPVVQAQSNKNVLSVDERDYFWKSYSNTNAVEVSNMFMEKKGISQKLDEYLGDKCYPGVFLLFHTQHDSYAYAGMNIVVDPEREKILYVEGFVTAAGFMPDEPSNVNPTSFTLDYWNDILNPLNPNYDPSMKWGLEGTRFGPPWDNVNDMPGH